MILTGRKRKYLGGKKTCPNATLSRKSVTRNLPGTNPSLRCEMPVTNRLSHGTATFESKRLSKLYIELHFLHHKEHS
jgi:hypothetical protein